MIARRALLAAVAATALAPRARAQNRVRRIGWLSGLDADDPQVVTNRAALVRGLKELGWVEGESYTVEFRGALGVAPRYDEFAAALVQAKPDLLIASGESALPALLRQTRTIPIVFIAVTDPVASGVVASLARPGGNATGFTQYEGIIGGKWVQLLKDIAPRITHIGVWKFDNPVAHAALEQFLPSIRETASALGLEMALIAVARDVDAVPAITAFGGAPNGGLVFPADPFSVVHRSEICAAVERAKMPAVYPFRFFAESGGLMSYAAGSDDETYRAAAYVDRILKGANPAELPVQLPVKYELVINMKAAKAIGLSVSPLLLARADTLLE
ncbi:MAG TPA: ABC transporter substrate-binding protein [Stellaceae bacterium]|nr:ABC transporter substrate-binding protein [Stellaceae bacterium]